LPFYLMPLPPTQIATLCLDENFLEEVISMCCPLLTIGIRLMSEKNAKKGGIDERIDDSIKGGVIEDMLLPQRLQGFVHVL